MTVVLLVQDVGKTLWGAPVCNPFTGASHCTLRLLAHPAVALSMVAITLCSVAFSALIIRRLPHRFPVEVVETKQIPNDIINYVFPYVVSFMGLSYADPDKMAGFSVFLLWMFAITYRSGQISMNPLLLLFGYQLYEAKVLIGQGEARVVRLLARAPPQPGPVRAELVQDFYFVEQRDEEGFR